MIRGIARTLAILITLFFGMFVAEGFGPGFTWQDSAAHALLALGVLGMAAVAWQWPRIGGGLFVLLGAYWLWTYWVAGLLLTHPMNALIVGGVPLATGILFIVDGIIARRRERKD